MSNDTVKLNILGIRGILGGLTSLLIGMVLLFGSAGTLYWVRGWFYICYKFLYLIFYISILLIVNPQLLNERGKFFLKETKPYDKYFVLSYYISEPSMLLIAGFDVRFQWSRIPLIIIYPSIVALILTSCIALWAHMSNSHFITTSRNDKVGDQQVCTTGPYRYIRHPGYVSAIIQWLCYPLLLGSLLSFIPALLYTSSIIVRTYYEDKTLQRELKGYEDYAKRTKYRLVPYVW